MALHRFRQRVDPRAVAGDRPDDRRPPGTRLAQGQHGLEVGGQPVGTGMVGLVDHEDVGDLQDPRLDRLDVVPLARAQDHQHRVGDAHDVDLVLADSDGLHQDRIAPGSVHQVDRVARGAAEAAETAARGHRADEDRGIERVLLHANAVPEDGAAAEGAARIDRDDADGAPPLAVLGDEAVGQGALAHAGRAGDPQDRGPAGAREDRGDDVLALARPLLHEGDGARQGERIAGGEGGRQAVFHGACSSAKPRMWRAITSRWISEVPSPMVVIFASR